MLNFIYYPVSAILWFWHKVFGFVLGANSGIAWALSVIFLVFTLRAILYKPFVKQIHTSRKMQELQPKMAAIRKQHKNDRQKMALEMQNLQKEHGFNPLMGCLPMLLQVPVFIGLFHVLRSFNRTEGTATSTFFGLLKNPNLTPAQNRLTPNYIFSAHDVQSFLDARLFHVPLSSFISMPKAQYSAFMNPVTTPPDFFRWQIVAVAVPLMVVAMIATHFNARASISRQTAEAAAQPQAAIMNRLALWIFPLFLVVSGYVMPIAILIYFVSNNLWTYVQQLVVFGRIAKEEEKAKQELAEKRAENAPKPGVKPNRAKKKGVTPPSSETAASSTVIEHSAVETVGTSKRDNDPSGASGSKKLGGRLRRRQNPVGDNDAETARIADSSSVSAEKTSVDDVVAGGSTAATAANEDTGSASAKPTPGAKPNRPKKRRR